MVCGYDGGMDVDRILAHPEYNIGSRSKLAARDDPWARVWLDGLDPLYEAYWRIRNRRIIPRKEFYETAFVLDRVADVLAGRPYLIEMAAGHGMLGLFAVLLHPSLRQVVHVDLCRPLSHDRILEQLATRYPYLKRQSRFITRSIEDLGPLPRGALVMGVHCCGGLTDRVVELAREARSDFVVVPCCESYHQLPRGTRRDLGHEGLPTRLAEIRRERWTGWGYGIEERRLPAAVTGKGRVMIGRWQGGP